MSEANPNPKVDAYLARATAWQDEMKELRQIALDSGLAEEVKWGHPCYTLDGSNIVLIHSFNDYCALLFFKGALLEDPDGVLVQQTENVQAARQIRFTSVSDVLEKEPSVRAAIVGAIDVERSGQSVAMKETAEFHVPEELQRRLNGDPDLKSAFDALTPGRQRGYLLHFSSAKRPETRESRIEQAVPRILAGKGLNDR